MRSVLIFSHTYVTPANRGKLRALAARGLDVTVGVPARFREPGLGRVIETGWERQSGVEIFPLPGRVGGSAPARFGSRPLAALVRDKRPELIQIEEEPGCSAARQVVQLARRLGVPAIVFTRENVAARLGPFARWRRRSTLRRLMGGKGKGERGGVIAGSGAAAAQVRREVPGLPIAVIPQLGVPVPPAAEHLPHEGLAVGYVGRLVEQKGLGTLLQALATNRAQRWHLTVVGDGPDRERLERLASDLRLAARIRWTGALPPHQLPGIWSALDVLVLPSLKTPAWEEQSAEVLMEAMAHEVAVVGSDAGVIPEVIGEAGVIVPAGDREALAAALRQLDGEARQPLAQAARARAMREYSDDAIAERTLTFWKELVG